MVHSHHTMMNHEHDPSHHRGHSIVHSSIAQTSMSQDMGMHSMTFHFGFEQFVLFEQWSAQNVTSLTITCLFFFVLAIIYEFIKAYRRVISVQHSYSNNISQRIQPQSISSSHHSSTQTETKVTYIGDSTTGLPGQCVGNNSANSSMSGTSHNGHQKLVRDCNDGSVYLAECYVQPNPGSTLQDVPEPILISHQRSSASSRMFANKNEIFNLKHLFETFLYTIQVVMAYLLMLAFMLFNVWICIAILFGAAIGHFFLAQTAAIALEDHPNEDHCH